MEWNRVKTILLTVMFLTNLFLAGNILLQIGGNVKEQNTAFELAMQALKKQTGEFNNDIFDDVKNKQYVYSCERDETYEENIAKKLLGENRESTAGGGIRVFTSENGKAVFRSGAVFELEWNEKDVFDIETYFVNRLDEIGFDIKNAEIKSTGETVSLRESFDKKSAIKNATILCTYSDGKCTVSGRWTPKGELGKIGGCKSSQEMLLLLTALCQKENIINAPQSCEIAYLLDTDDDNMLVLSPIWKVEFENKTLLINCETGKQVKT